ncbi:unnamed protein product [Effrenium voratum]|nr:unnamed protein product [Effrenium voratum]
MWSLPPSAPPLEKGESAFNAVEIDDLAQCQEPNIRQKLSGELLRRLARLRTWLQSKEVVLDLRRDFVSPEAAIVGWIERLHPWTMSWSNVLDYLPPKEFHKLARSCSAQGDTIHYGYSMNWIAEVYGSCIMDYDGHPEAVAKIIEGSHEMCQQAERLMPSGKLLLLPPHETPMNITGHFLAMGLHKRWARYFFSDAGELQVGMFSMQTYNPLATNANCLSMTWTYDMDMELKSASGTELADDAMPDCPMS